jgi:hypothetical protein
MVDLNQLKTDIEALGEKGKELKTSGGDKDAIGAAVAEMLAKKKEYADNNNGIGFDGNPYEEPLSKAQKKAKAKAEKDADEAAAGPAKQVSLLIWFYVVLYFWKDSSDPIHSSIHRPLIPIPRVLPRRLPKLLPKPLPKLLTRLVKLLLQLRWLASRVLLQRLLLRHLPPRPSRPRFRLFHFPQTLVISLRFKWRSTPTWI